MKKLLLHTFLFITFFCEAQQYLPVLEFQKCFGGSGDDRIYSAAKTREGGLIMAATTESTDGDVLCNGSYKYWITKLDDSLKTIWQTCLGGSYSELPSSIIETSDFGYLVGGDSESDDVSGHHINTNGTNFDIWIVKLNNSGNVQWQKSLGGTRDDRVLSVLEIKDEGYLVLCRTESSDGDLTSSRTEEDTWLVKLDYNGNILWQRTYDEPGLGYFINIKNTMDNGYLLLGANDSLDGGMGQQDAWILKTDHSGDVQWQKGFGTIFLDYAIDAVQLEDSSFLVLGNENMGSVWVLHMDKRGEIIWQKTYGGTGYESPAQITKLKNNTFYITGTTNSIDGDVEGIHIGDNGIGGNTYDIWLIQINTNGDLIYQRCLGGSDDEAGFTLNSWLEMTSDSTFNLVGSSSSTDGDLEGIHYPSSTVNSDIWIMKFKIITANSISGIIYHDNNTNCVQESIEDGISNVIMKTEPANFYGISDTSGKYHILTDIGSYQLKPIYPQILKPFLQQTVCPTSGYHTVSFSQYGQDTSEINFANYEKQCPFLQLELSQGRMRRCFDNNATIKYCNIGNVDTTNVQVIIQLPEYVTFVSASNPNYIISGKKITFNIGNLRANECGTINLVTNVDCIEGIVGLTQCIKAQILPRNECVRKIQPDYAGWDKSEITTDGTCTGASVRFVIKNIGQNMADSSNCRIYKNAVQALSKNFKLLAGDSLVINVSATGHTYRLEADQTLNFPSPSAPSVTIENCNNTSAANRNFVNQQEQDKSDIAIEKVCLEIRDSYDPNDKQVFPSGVGSDKRVRHKVPLDFLIRFQNTGTDTAYKVVITDTLDQNLDLATLEFGASSHSYKFEFTGAGKPIMKFTFDKINLVDSFTNEPKSHGFISFKITPYDSIPNGTLVKNNADIYFDFNLPIKTNTTQVSIDDRLPTGATLNLVTSVKQNNTIYEAIYVYPNPFTQTATFEFVYNTKANQLLIYDMKGNVVAQENIAGKTTFQLQRANLSNGMYFYAVLNNSEEIIGRGKLVLQ
jgi:hypothetical protein